MKVKDFTLTNVKRTTKLYEIKHAIEKLKGYKVECQNLSLLEEGELYNFTSTIRQTILHPIITDLLNL